MKYVLRSIIVVLILMVIAAAVIPAVVVNDGHLEQSEQIKQWDLVWVDQLDGDMTDTELRQLSGWRSADAKHPAPGKPEEASSVWIRLELPAFKIGNPAILIEGLYGRRIIAMLDGNPIYQADRRYDRDLQQFILPLHMDDSDKAIYLGVEGVGDRIGLQEAARIGDFNQLMDKLVKKDITDFILGSAFIFIAVIMLMCSLFLNTENMPSWLSLCLVILCIGILIITYSPFLYSFYDKFGALYYRLFDVALLVLLPAFSSFFERIFDSGYHAIIRKYRKFQVLYSVFCLVFMVSKPLWLPGFSAVYSFLTGTLLGIIMIIQFALLVTLSVIYATRGNKEAIIFTSGFALFALTAIGELAWYYLENPDYRLYLWKWGVVCFVISLIIILGRRFARNHDQVVEYSRRLEMFNNELQRSEKMEIISELAASVAHEVRNPLQVTRGFLQLLTEKSQNQDKLYLNLALEELDRASNIITDFLTFAKPEVGKIATLHILDEFRHIEGILNPMANLQGGKIYVDIPDNLQIKGNSPKFKQAFVNILKNSIEALRGEGEIRVWAYESGGKVVIHVKDNGEGMSGAELAHLGEPYFSNKTKGTGLGLMVTFRIIEVMQGDIQFKSEKGRGTEAIIRFPSVES
ncbi:sensor histidine kinase [Paenibacillus sp. CAA11]|uniref:sensor histidine kinase n=1 Tax=Paenibacillus sp. CAA11 TaxID=1532905 RepID=UPI000D37630E|nr:sensor histidine kinase [Paenibacillus sp. CAA11]AWB43598.1 sensor histidine kinase [Paenibacillus sp. CAA11]